MIYTFPQKCVGQEHLHLPDLHQSLQAGRAGAEPTALRHARDDQTRPGMGTGDKFANWNMGVSINGGTPK